MLGDVHTELRKLGENGGLVDRQLQRALQCRVLPKLPWEDQPRKRIKTLAEVRSDSASPMLGYSDFLKATLVVESVGESQVQPGLPVQTRTVKLAYVPADPDHLRAQSINRVRLMIESDLSATKLGKVLYELASDLGNEGKIAATLTDTFAKKAPATLYKRTSSLWAYFKRNSRGDYRATLHVTEARVYEYVSELREEAGASAAKHFTEALNFFSALVGFLKFDVVEILSPRVKGVVHSALAAKRPRKQARPLTAAEVKGLEELVLKSLDEFVKMAAGFCLFCLANAGRWSDAQAAEGLKLDTSGRRPVIEAGTFRHKTASGAERKTTLLPYVGFGCLLANNAWAKTWLDVVQQVKTKEDVLGRGHSGPSRPASNNPDVRRRSSVANNAFVESNYPELGVQAWYTIPARAHGVRPSFGQAFSVSALTYGRANFVEPLRKLHQLLLEVEQGRFVPDAKPSALITAELEQLDEKTEEFERLMGGDAPLDADSASEVDDAGDAEEQAEEVVPRHERRREVLRDQGKFLCHAISGCLHVKTDQLKFLCGRIFEIVMRAEEQCFTPIPLSACTSRESEMRADKKDPVALRIEGTIRITKTAALPHADTSTELHVRACMQRRALAMQLASVATFSVLDSWITKLFAHMMKPTLTNMKPPSLHQLLDADKTLWMLVAQNTRGEMLTAGPVLPIDHAIKTRQDCPDVSFCLLPQRGGSSKRRLSPDSDSGDEPEGGKRKKKKKKGGKAKEDKKTDPPPGPPGPRLPKLDLPKGARTKDEDKKPLCFGYSRGTCPHQDKEKCSRGHHRCWWGRLCYDASRPPYTRTARRAGWIRAKANAFVASRLPKPRRHVLFYAQPRDVQQIAATYGGFAARLGDGTVVTWGHPQWGTNDLAVRHRLKDVKHICASDGAFAAILEDGSVVCWGEAEFGGDSEAVQPQLREVQRLFATSCAFAALRADDTVVTWGAATHGGASRRLRTQLRDVRSITANLSAFAALRGDGTVVTWGDCYAGGNSSRVQSKLQNVRQIQATDKAFAAIVGNGEVVAWGHPDYGGDCSSVQDMLKQRLT
ncbi:unnamed protein product [Symbiodinium microadriaticum]|nr:unnamed protein product [Symbiodinium microadriaticum]